MDNLSSHKVQEACERIERCGAEVLYLPPTGPTQAGLNERRAQPSSEQAAS
jgi:hypothetical protein